MNNASAYRDLLVRSYRMLDMAVFFNSSTKGGSPFLCYQGSPSNRIVLPAACKIRVPMMCRIFLSPSRLTYSAFLKV